MDIDDDKPFESPPPSHSFLTMAQGRARFYAVNAHNLITEESEKVNASLTTLAGQQDQPPPQPAILRTPESRLYYPQPAIVETPDSQLYYPQPAILGIPASGLYYPQRRSNVQLPSWKELLGPINDPQNPPSQLSESTPRIYLRDTFGLDRLYGDRYPGDGQKEASQTGPDVCFSTWFQDLV